MAVTNPAAQLASAEIKVTLQNLIFSSPPREDGRAFSVWAVETDDGAQVTATAEMEGTAWGAAGDAVVLAGRWHDHPRYGRQFQVDHIRPHIPTGGKGLIRWLCRQEGIGPVTAERVVLALGDDALEKVAADPAAVDSIADLTDRQKDAVHQAAAAYQKEHRRAEVLIWCFRHGFGPVQSEAIWREYGADAPGLLTAHPWLLTGLKGFGFLRADELARSLGVVPDAGQRMTAAVSHALEMAAQEEGHVFLMRSDLVRRTVQMLEEIARKTGYGSSSPGLPARVARAVDDLVDRRGAVEEDGRIYDPYLYHAERQVRAWLAARRTAPGLVSREEADRVAGDPEVRGGLDDVQTAAVAMALCHGASALTGGPGTGKSSSTASILAAIRKVRPGARVLLAAPTGRAARRLAEVTGEEALTIHRLLDFGPVDGGKFGFRRHAGHPLEGDFLVVDESSMADLPLMAALVIAVPPGMPVLFVGDADQLPPVGPGAPFHAITGQGLLPVARLQRIYRQGAGSPIPLAARAVNRGEMPVEVPGDRTFRVVVHPRPPRDLAGAAREAALMQLRQAMAQDVLAAVMALRQRYGFAPDEIQVLTPTRRGPCGAPALNEVLREVLNPQGRHQGIFALASGREFWLGDRVMQLTNDYNKGVFNGEQGRVVAVNVPVGIPTSQGYLEKTGFEVEFEDGSGVRRVPYWSGDAGNLELAYASTIHKSQGSEYPAVVMVVGWDSYLLLQRQLIYTGMTRASRHLIVIAEEGALERAVATVDGVQRNQVLTM